MKPVEFRNKIFLGHNLDWLGQIPDRSVHSVITSPSYLGLRDYGIPPSIWGGSADCEHEWGAEIPSKFASHWETIEWKDGRPQEASQGWKDRVRTSKIVSCGVFCRKCGAWRGCFGQEPEIEMYLEHSLQIYTEIYRILRDDGAFWLNIGDSYWGSGNAAGHTPETVNFGKVTDIYGATKGHTQKKHKVLKSKDQCLIPHRLALSLQGFTIVPSDALWQTADTLKDARESGDWESVKLVEEMLRRWAFASQMVNPAGWILRSTIIWLKGNV